MNLNTKWIRLADSVQEKEYGFLTLKNPDECPVKPTNGGSYSIFFARLLGLSYPEYIYYLTSTMGDSVKIWGKDHKYPSILFKKGKGEVMLFISLLNNKYELYKKNYAAIDKENKENE